VRRSPELYGLFCSNYSCGPDSFTGHTLSWVMEGKPFAIIETDGHSGDAGTNAVGNSRIGILISYVSGSGSGSASANRIGSAVPGAGNVVAGNGFGGIRIVEATASGNVIQGNSIGTKADGTSALGNVYHNVELHINATNNSIGGAAPGEGNHIAFAQTSLRSGVRVRAAAEII